eukprot:COSAG04_NODE_3997_length_2370_cov_89.698258_4_plen_117_part_00
MNAAVRVSCEASLGVGAATDVPEDAAFLQLGPRDPSYPAPSPAPAPDPALAAAAAQACIVSPRELNCMRIQYWANHGYETNLNLVTASDGGVAAECGRLFAVYTAQIRGAPLPGES